MAEPFKEGTGHVWRHAEEDTAARYEKKQGRTKLVTKPIEPQES